MFYFGFGFSYANIFHLFRSGVSSADVSETHPPQLSPPMYVLLFSCYSLYLNHFLFPSELDDSDDMSPFLSHETVPRHLYVWFFVNLITSLIFLHL